MYWVIELVIYFQVGASGPASPGRFTTAVYNHSLHPQFISVVAAAVNAPVAVVEATVTAPAVRKVSEAPDATHMKSHWKRELW